jgi:hypothetical protein
VPFHNGGITHISAFAASQLRTKSSFCTSQNAIGETTPVISLVRFREASGGGLQFQPSSDFKDLTEPSPRSRAITATKSARNSPVRPQPLLTSSWFAANTESCGRSCL